MDMFTWLLLATAVALGMILNELIRQLIKWNHSQFHRQSEDTNRILGTFEERKLWAER